MLERIMIVDDHPSVREGLVALVLKNMFTKEIIQAGTVNDAYYNVKKFKPELILMDISLRGLSGIELSKKILTEFPDILIVILSMYSKTKFIVDSLNAGVRGYILKEAEPAKIVKGIKKVLDGELYVDSRISGNIINSLLKKSDDKLNIDNDAYEMLSFREQEVLRLLADGLEVKEIAVSLSISIKTVNNHRTNIMSKLNCRNNVELVRYAFHIGLVDL